jgi:hypothetical protein
MATSNNTLIGIAGVHHVVSELSRRGLIALPTVKNTAAYDIVALNQEGTRHANIQVKASSKRVGFFPMPPPEKIRTSPNDYFVLARWLDDQSKYQCYLLTGREARTEVERAICLQQSRVHSGSRGKTFPCAHVNNVNAVAASKWEAAWLAWQL